MLPGGSISAENIAITLLCGSDGIFYLKYTLLDVFSPIYYISNYKNNSDDQECDKSGVAKVFGIDIGVVIPKLGSCCCKVKIVSIVTMPKKNFATKKLLYN